MRKLVKNVHGQDFGILGSFKIQEIAKKAITVRLNSE
jgi:rRNA processing protein Krr1/Pno1